MVVVHTCVDSASCTLTNVRVYQQYLIFRLDIRQDIKIDHLITLTIRVADPDRDIGKDMTTDRSVDKRSRR
jgi:hypothetical protein